MKDSFKFDYFYGSQAEQFSFFRLPKILIRDERFKKISSDANSFKIWQNSNAVILVSYLCFIIYL